MTRIKTGIVRRQKHKKVLKQTRGYRMTRHRLYKVAHESLLHAGQYAYIGRKNRKRDFRRLWITRISAGSKQLGISYSQFIRKLKLAKIELDRSVLSDLVVNDIKTFKLILDKVKSL